jgi:hypothetical protein
MRVKRRRESRGGERKSAGSKTRFKDPFELRVDLPSDCGRRVRGGGRKERSEERARELGLGRGGYGGGGDGEKRRRRSISGAVLDGRLELLVQADSIMRTITIGKPKSNSKSLFKNH